MSRTQDRNFDDLAERFEQKVYSTVKGDWRLKLIREDLDFLCKQPVLQVWDAGCGHARIGQWLAQNGHRLTLCDISENMLQRARKNFEQAGLHAEFHHRSAQSLAGQRAEFDLVLCHAVIEWLAEPLPSLAAIAATVKKGGHLSLLFYNRNAMVYGNTLRGGWRLKHLLDDRYLGRGSKLTPPNPQFPHTVVEMLEGLGFDVVVQTGIRVFHDYLSSEARAASDESELFALEARYCREPTFRDMGRYIHLLLRKKA